MAASADFAWWYPVKVLLEAPRDSAQAVQTCLQSSTKATTFQRVKVDVRLSVGYQLLAISTKWFESFAKRMLTSGMFGSLLMPKSFMFRGKIVTQLFESKMQKRLQDSDPFWVVMAICDSFYGYITTNNLVSVQAFSYLVVKVTLF
jgi:hypothetical protein